MLEFSDILVAPFDGLLEQGAPGHHHLGGPIWPDWDSQTVARHCGHAKPLDTKPEAPKVWRNVETAQWCGPIHWHFGHMTAEFSMRILPSVFNDNDAPLLFCGFPPRQYVGQDDPIALTPKFFQGILEYTGLPRERILISGEALRVAHLSVEPQAELLFRAPSDPSHLDRLDAHAEKMLGPVVRDGVAFISRAGMFARFAGEPYIEHVLRQAGVRVFRPETLSLMDQLRAYRSHAHVIFSEGSALHGPQFLGHCFGRLDVFRRAEGSNLNAAALRPRSEELNYWSFMRGSIQMLGPGGNPWRLYALSVMDPEAFLEVMERIGVPVTRFWDADAFAEAQAQDVHAWVTEAQNTRFPRQDPRVPQTEVPPRLWDVPGNPEVVARGVRKFFGISIERP